MTISKILELYARSGRSLEDMGLKEAALDLSEAGQALDLSGMRLAGAGRAAGRSHRVAHLQHLPVLRRAVRRRRSRKDARRAATGVDAVRPE